MASGSLKSRAQCFSTLHQLQYNKHNRRHRREKNLPNSALTYHKTYLSLVLTYMIGSASIPTGLVVNMSLNELSTTWKGIACIWTV